MRWIQFRALLLFFIRLKLRQPALLVAPLLSIVAISLAFPQRNLGLSTGFLTLFSSFFFWVIIATNLAISHRQTRLKILLIYNGASIFFYNLAFFLCQILQLILMAFLCLILHFIAQSNSYTFFFNDYPAGLLMLGVIGFGLCFLCVAMLLTQCLSDSYSLFFLYTLTQTLIYPLFGTEDMGVIGSSKRVQYYYFGYNYVLTPIHNFYIAYFLSLLFAIVYFIVDQLRHSFSFRERMKSCCCCLCSKPKSTQKHSEVLLDENMEMDNEATDYLLRLEGVTKKYKAFRALDNVEFKIPKNKITCIVGKNGSGKTTLLRVLTGQESISRGAGYLKQNGEQYLLNSLDKGAAHLSIGFCAQQNNLPLSLTLAELIHLFSSLKDSPIFQNEQTRRYQQDLLIKLNLINYLNSKYGSLSIGAKRRVALMMALLNRPDLILLDEPVNGLDDVSQREFWQILERLKGQHTMVVITHNISSSEDTVDYCGILHEGALVRFTEVDTLKEEIKDNIVLRARKPPQCRLDQYPDFSEQIPSGNPYFKEQIIKATDSLRFQHFIEENRSSIISVSPLSLQSQINQISELRSSSFNFSNRRDFSLLIEKEFSHFCQPKSDAWFWQLAILYSRRSRLLWLNFRNYGAACSIFVDVLFTSQVFGQNGFYFIFKVVDLLDIVLVQDVIQRSLKKINLQLNTSGVSSFQYQVANLLAHSTFLVFTYLLLLLVLSLIGNFDLSADSLLPSLVLGILAGVSFSQFFALLFKDVKLGLGVFSFLICYISLVLFSYNQYIVLFLPITFFGSLISQYLSESEVKISKSTNISFSLELGILAAQTVVYLALAVLVDKMRRGIPICQKSNKINNTNESDSQPISVNLEQARGGNKYQYIVKKGSVASLYGPTQSGKSQLINLLGGISKHSFKGSCIVQSCDLLKGQPLPSKRIGVCLDEDYLEQSFTLFYHLYFTGQLRGLTNQQNMHQIFYLAKLLDMEEHLLKRIEHLSGGNKRKAALASALLGAPSLLIIDEPTRSLDPAVSRQVLLAIHFFVHSLGNTFLFSSKKLSEVVLVADSVISLPSPSIRPLCPISNYEIEKKIILVIHYSVKDKVLRMRIKMEDVTASLPSILERIKEEEGQFVTVSLEIGS